ncbi:MAG: hypothetical protein IH987_06445 [Planctomycetes bacterium]|nr:hypothetical protein [Planctomycetota bacterium]
MNDQIVCGFSAPCFVRKNSRLRAFSLVELMTVTFIISALIAILVPSLNGARNSAKKTSTMATLHALEAGLEMFRNDNERQFARTNGYPPSFAHPRMLDSSGNDIFEAHAGAFPFDKYRPVVSGAHWLPAMLMGVDQQGYIKGKTVTKRDNLRYEPWRWYTPDPLGDGTSLERAGFYVDPGGVKTVQTRDLPGRPNGDMFELVTDELLILHDPFASLPVIVDAFGQPILYYVANAHGRPSNMVEDARNKENAYCGGPPVYFHQDNELFTGNEDARGWDFDGPHKIARAGGDFTADQLVDASNVEAQESFARFIVDRTLYRNLLNRATEENRPPSCNAPLRPVNADSYLLISASVDGRYGTNDDVTNFPLAVE